MSTKYVLALDQGTTSSRAILFDNEQNIIAVQQREFEQIYPQQGWVEHNPMEIWSTQYGVMNEVVAQSGVDVHDIAAIGITNQRETTILWEKATGRPIYNAIVWQCRRTAPLVDELVQQPGMTEYIRENTGLMPDAYFSATKIKWILDNVPGARERAEAGGILFGTVDTWLVWKLTGGKVHVTDRTNASRTMLYNIRTLDWDDTLLKALDIPFEAHILSAHRTPAEAAAFAKSAKANGFGVILCAAGMAAHLAGAFAANTTLPVIGIPMKGGAMDGLDALLATVQMPSGMPVATVAIDGAANAALLAAQILSVEDEALAEKLLAMRRAQHDAVIAKDAALIVE